MVLATDDAGGPEIFATVQGEGTAIGRPATFVRLSRCNLACTWCDTPYTWHWEGDPRPHADGVTFDRKANQVTLDIAEVAHRVCALPPNDVVFTGGEPMMQQKALLALADLLDEMAPYRFSYAVETNGTVLPEQPHRFEYTVSPKLAHSGNDPALALPFEAMAHWAQSRHAIFKFVIANPEDVLDVDALVQRFSIHPGAVLLMPEGRESQVLHARAKWLAPICIQKGYRLTDRLHIHLFGDTRGT
ncbi:7-carboxy-7-deazaguanine synthase QueE [Erythrobacter sp. EC-HK427]|uniref:7-carboxy-7-deazaguanine synthase QueE n=1 Tax=Erythrobacter sp. EC-HK427 TaxID=2038396 RepID=UPI0030D9AD31